MRGSRWFQRHGTPVFSLVCNAGSRPEQPAKIPPEKGSFLSKGQGGRGSSPLCGEEAWLVAAHFGGWTLVHGGRVPWNPFRPSWAEHSNFSDLALTRRIFSMCEAWLQAWHPNLAETSDFSLKTQKRARGRATSGLLRRPGSTEYCCLGDEGPGLGCSCHRKGEGRAALRRKTRLVACCCLCRWDRKGEDRSTGAGWGPGALPSPHTAAAAGLSARLRQLLPWQDPQTLLQLLVGLPGLAKGDIFFFPVVGSHGVHPQNRGICG